MRLVKSIVIEGSDMALSMSKVEAALNDGWQLLTVIPLVERGTTTYKRELWFVK